MRISDWSSDVCSSDLEIGSGDGEAPRRRRFQHRLLGVDEKIQQHVAELVRIAGHRRQVCREVAGDLHVGGRSEEHTSEIQSLMRISYAVFCLKKKTQNHHSTTIASSH